MHGDPDNLETLHNKREYEHYRKATAEYIELLLDLSENSLRQTVQSFETKL